MVVQSKEKSFVEIIHRMMPYINSLYWLWLWFFWMDSRTHFLFIFISWFIYFHLLKFIQFKNQKLYSQYIYKTLYNSILFESIYQPRLKSTASSICQFNRYKQHEINSHFYSHQNIISLERQFILRICIIVYVLFIVFNVLTIIILNRKINLYIIYT